MGYEFPALRLPDRLQINFQVAGGEVEANESLATSWRTVSASFLFSPSAIALSTHTDGACSRR